ncbi:MAG: hypothetical protein DRR16_02800 [Candidatus Parabeggiatoa sp. nov. 3]|nr:MAG: hypothetical protein DRR00_05070 [Gammaproteobacteria bacterium]RKZ55508.1 MAG: hypothetical protein DRQ99_29890 [Gammaproteobacteria bacterium]RKZ89299.1 MAG: hypothetical protein DRR16_02800 [Gammaproteobacteria bacterium]
MRKIRTVWIILFAGINFQAKVRAANFCLKNFWQPQVATWGYDLATLGNEVSHSTPPPPDAF